MIGSVLLPRVVDALDPGIRDFVVALNAGGVETFESCQGGEGHCRAENFIRFHGGQSAGWHALAVAKDVAMPVLELRRTWDLIDGSPTGPWWEMTFRTTGPR